MRGSTWNNKRSERKAKIMMTMADVVALESLVRARVDRDLEHLRWLRETVERIEATPRVWTGPAAAEGKGNLEQKVTKATKGEGKSGGGLSANDAAREWIGEQSHGREFTAAEVCEAVTWRTGLLANSKVSVFLAYLVEKGQLERRGRGLYQVTNLFSVEKSKGGRGKAGFEQKETKGNGGAWAMREQIAAEVAAKKGLEE